MRVKLNKATAWAIFSLFFLPVLVGLFYFEENWRGRHDWETCRARLKAKGEVMDWNILIPLSVPDNQNFFKAPKMQAWFVKAGGTTTNELTERLHNSETTASITNETAALSYLAWSDQFQPDFELIRTALKRPYAQMEGDYSDPLHIPIQNSVALRAVSQTLAQRAKCHLLLHQPDAALNELTLLHDCSRIVESRPFGRPMTSYAALLNAAMVNVYVKVVADGLRQHSFKETQLAIIQKQLAEVNLFPFLADAMRQERLVVCYLIESMFVGNFDPERSYLATGWFYQNMVSASMWDQRLIDSLDLADNTIFPEKVNAVHEEIGTIKYFRPNTFIGKTLVSGFNKKFIMVAQSQAYANEAQIACALERYCVVNGKYPDTLAMLLPQLMKSIPRDVIKGQSLHYHRTEDGSFSLYSVG